MRGAGEPDEDTGEVSGPGGGPLGRDPFSGRRDSFWKTPPNEAPGIMGGERQYLSGGVADYVEPPWTPVDEPVAPESRLTQYIDAPEDEEAMIATAESEKSEETVSLVGMRVGGELYGIGIKYVKEVVRMRRITPAPNSAPHVAGVISLRGEIIPVVSLWLLFGFPKTASSASARIVVIAAAGGLTGLLVDEVTSLEKISVSSIIPPMEGARMEGDFVIGSVKAGGDHVTLLDIEKTLTLH